jgi:hypothetical protein
MLTITKATAQARRHVDKIMPGVMATVESRLTADPVTLEDLMITTVTFPDGHEARHLLLKTLATTLPGYRETGTYSASSRIVLYRTR